MPPDMSANFEQPRTTALQFYTTFKDESCCGDVSMCHDVSWLLLIRPDPRAWDAECTRIDLGGRICLAIPSGRGVPSGKGIGLFGVSEIYSGMTLQIS